MSLFGITLEEVFATRGRDRVGALTDDTWLQAVERGLHQCDELGMIDRPSRSYNNLVSVVVRSVMVANGALIQPIHRSNKPGDRATYCLVWEQLASE